MFCSYRYNYLSFKEYLRNLKLGLSRYKLFEELQFMCVFKIRVLDKFVGNITIESKPFIDKNKIQGYNTQIDYYMK